MAVKCCFCFDLKKGFFAYGIILLASRVALIGFLYWLPKMIDPAKLDANTRAIYPTIGLTMGWLIASSFCLFLALKGIMEKRSVLLFPFLTVSLFEIVSSIFWNIILAIVMGPQLILNIFVVAGINGYTFVCLYALYKQFKAEEALTRSDGMETPLLATI